MSVTPERARAMPWKGVSYIGKSARIERSRMPPVQEAVPSQAWRATPSVVMPSSIAARSSSRMFSFGPWVAR